MEKEEDKIMFLPGGKVDPSGRNSVDIHCRRRKQKNVSRGKHSKQDYILPKKKSDENRKVFIGCGNMRSPDNRGQNEIA